LNEGKYKLLLLFDKNLFDLFHIHSRVCQVKNCEKFTVEVLVFATKSRKIYKADCTKEIDEEQNLIRWSWVNGKIG
jgi:hypothetical protein